MRGIKLGIINSIGLASGALGGVTPISFTGITKATALGDSIMAGASASPGNSFIELLVAAYGWNLSNFTLGGSGVWNEAKNTNQQTYTRIDTVMMMEAGLNDIRRNSTQATFNKIESCLKNNIANAFAKAGTIRASGSSFVTRSGSFLAFDGFGLGHRYGTGAIPGNTTMVYNTTANATWTHSFTGTGIAVSFNGAYSLVTRGNCEIRIDGVLVDTITDLNQRYDGVSDGVYNNQRGPDTRYYLGLTNTTHTIEVKALSTDPVPVDYFATIDVPANLGVVFVLDVPRVTDYAKPGLNQANDTIIAQVNALRRTVVSDWAVRGYRIANIPIPAPDAVNMDPDGVHRTTAGHLQIFQGIARYIA